VSPLPVLLVDTNVIIEAVRTGCWRAVTGHMTVETVEVCKEESGRGNADRAGYVVVSAEELSRIARVHPVSGVERAALALDYPEAAGMDAGERDLFAHAKGRQDEHWMLCSPDKASIRAAVSLGWADRLRSLGALVHQLGARPRPSLKTHFEESWLSHWRTHFLLEEGLA
jgi:hypothetical protein